MKKSKKDCLVLGKVAIIALMSILLGVTVTTGNNLPTASSGVLNLSAHDLYLDGSARLDGNWQFFQGTVLTPKDFLNHTCPQPTGHYQVPKYWTAYKGLSLDPEGVATYRLLIQVKKKNRPLSLLTPEIFTEYRLFINGKLIDSHGSFSNGRIRFLSPRIFTFQNSNEPIEIILNIANHNHGNAGIGQSFFLGSPDTIQQQHLNSTIIEMILVAVCLFAGIYHLILFLLRRQEKELMYFGFFCLLIAIRTLMTGTTYITHIFPDIPFETASRPATAVIPMCIMSFQTFAFYFFQPYFPVKPHRALLLLHCTYLILSFAVPPMIYSKLFAPYFMVIAASCVLIIIVNAYSIKKHFRYAIIFMAGLLFSFIGVANDMLHYMQIINTGYYLSLWFSFFIIAQSVMLAIKFANEHIIVEALSKKLQVTDKLKDEFLANTSHELRTPINGIIGISDSLIDGIAGDLPTEATANLQLISSSGRRLTSLINDILDYSKLRNNDILLVDKEIDLRQIAEVVLTVIKVTAPSKNLKLVNDVSCSFPNVRGDENRLQQILFNLIGNAVKFTDQGHVRIWAQDKGSHVIVHVEDTGPGIPEKKFSSIFESFEQIDGSTTRDYGGTGLGLSITKKLVELLGGIISVHSVEQQGSTFSFTLPKGASGYKSEDKKSFFGTKNHITENIIEDSGLSVFAPPMDCDNLTGERILIVDDDITNVRVLENYLFLESYRFDHAVNGIKAIEMLGNSKFDLVLLDIMMPRMSGYEVLRHIRKQHTAFEIPVLMLTAGKQSRDIVTAFQSGANDYLTKPIDRQELMARIRTQLDLSHAVDNAIKNADLANTDELTGLRNRRFLINSGNREYTNACLHNKPLSLLMMDIDLFKKVNDTYGHAEGDRILKHFAGIIKNNIRGIDLAARYGGEEFVIILPGTSQEGAGKIAEKIRQLVAQSRVPTAENKKIIRYTVSLGTASFHDPECCFKDLINDADKMLYISKKEGRNRVTIHIPPV